jgi:cytochrome b
MVKPSWPNILQVVFVDRIWVTAVFNDTKAPVGYIRPERLFFRTFGNIILTKKSRYPIYIRRVGHIFRHTAGHATGRAGRRFAHAPSGI